ncbi:hypothetical protein ACX80V_00390 [Arthrobacter sp. MDT3-24]
MTRIKRFTGPGQEVGRENGEFIKELPRVSGFQDKVLEAPPESGP